MSSPAIIYLDSSDFSNIAVATSSSDPKWEPWRMRVRQLLAARDRGIAEFRFSHAHVLEAYPMTEQSRELAIGRAEAITTLCGENCLSDLLELFLNEAIAIISTGHALPRKSARKDDGTWHPDLGQFAAEFARQFAVDMNRIAKAGLKTIPNLNRAHRRSMRRRYIRSNGRLTSEGASLASEDDRRQASLAVARFLNRPEIGETDLPWRVLAGQLPVAELARELHLSIRRPDLLFRRTDLDHSDGLFGWLRDLGRGVHSPAETMRRRLAEIVNTVGLEEAKALAAPFLSNVQAWQSNLRLDILQSLRERNAAALRSLGISASRWDTVCREAPNGSLPGLDSMLQAFSVYVYRAFSPSRFHRHPSPSDAADLVHMAYIPYVDIFRCDAHAAQIARPIAGASGVRTATSIEEALEMATNMSR